LTPGTGDTRVLGRDGPLGQVFRNLIDNARSFSPAGGEVRVVLHRNEADPTRALGVTVDDDGPGIPPDNLETVFERFYTSRPKGGTAFGANSGLGLSIVRQIVEAHGGRVQAENRTGTGRRGRRRPLPKSTCRRRISPSSGAAEPMTQPSTRTARRLVRPARAGAQSCSPARPARARATSPCG
jgi:hypothetical protein